MSHIETQGLGTFRTSLVRIGEFVFRWLPLVIVTLLWEYASGVAVSEAVLAPPSEVFVIVVDMLVSGEILGDLFISVMRVVLGLALSIAIGVLLGITMARSDPIENFFDVFVTLVYPLPKTALVPLAVLWLGSGTATAVLVVFLACLLPIVLNSYNAAESVDQNLVWSARMMGTSDRDLLRKVVIPASIPEIMTGVRQAVPIAFVALVSAELIASNQGMGYQILRYGQFGNYASMFAVIVIFSSVSYFGVRGFERLEERVLIWT